MIKNEKRSYPNRHRRHPSAEVIKLKEAQYDVLKILARYRFMTPTDILQLMPPVEQRISPNTLKRKGERTMSPETLAMWQEAETEEITRVKGKQEKVAVYLKVKKPMHPRTLKGHLQFLYNNGFVVRQPRETDEWIYSIGTKGASALLEHQDHLAEAKMVEAGKDYDRLNTEPGSLHLEHTRMIGRVRASLTLAMPAETADYPKYNDNDHWRFEGKSLKADVSVEGLDRPLRIIPDGFFRIQTPDGILSFLLEVIRHNPEAKRLLPKLKAYAMGQSEFKDLLKISAFRVVILTTSEIRRDNIVRMIQKEFEYDDMGWMFLVGAELNMNPHARVVEPERCFDVARPVGILAPIWRCGTAGCHAWHRLVDTV